METSVQINLNYLTGKISTFTYYGTEAATPADVWFGYTASREIGDKWTECDEADFERVEAEAEPILEELREVIVNTNYADAPIKFTDTERALELIAKLDALLETIEIERFEVAVYGEGEYDEDIEQLAAEAISGLPEDATEIEKIDAIEAELARMAADLTRSYFAGEGVTFRYEVEDFDALFEALNDDEDEDEDE